MRLDGSRKYKRVSEHQLVDVDEPDSAARRLQHTLVRLEFTLKDWRVVASTAGLPESGEEPPTFSWIEDRPPQLDLRLDLKADKRNFYAVKDGEGVTPIDQPINFRILPAKEGTTVGYVQHVPEWEYGGVKHEHSIDGALFIPPDRMDWLVEQLGRPNARLHLGLHVMLYKEEIAAAFDEPWYTQDIVLPFEEQVALMGYRLDVVAGPVPLDDELPEPEEEEAFEADYAVPDEPAAQSPPQAVTIADPRLNWVLYLLVALVLIEFFRR